MERWQTYKHICRTMKIVVYTSITEINAESLSVNKQTIQKQTDRLKCQRDINTKTVISYHRFRFEGDRSLYKRALDWPWHQNQRENEALTRRPWVGVGRMKRMFLSKLVTEKREGATASSKGSIQASDTIVTTPAGQVCVRE